MDDRSAAATIDAPGARCRRPGAKLPMRCGGRFSPTASARASPRAWPVNRRCSRRAPPPGRASRRRWYALSAAASVAAVALVGSMAFGSQPQLVRRRRLLLAQAKPRSEAPPATGADADSGQRLPARAPGLFAAHVASRATAGLRAHGVGAESGRARRAGSWPARCSPGWGWPAAGAQAQSEALGLAAQDAGRRRKSCPYTGTFLYQNGTRSETSRHMPQPTPRGRHRETRSPGRNAARQAHRTRCAATCPACGW